MTAHELPNGNLVVPLHPAAPGPKGDEAMEIGPDHPDYEKWLPEATREAVYGAWRRVKTLEEVETAHRAVDRFEAEEIPDPSSATGADVAIGRAMLEEARKRLEHSDK